MVDTNQESLQNEAAAKKRKDTPKKGGVKGNTEEKGVVKKLPVRKDNTQVKSQGQSKAPAPKGQTVAKLQKFLKGAWSELKKVHWPNRREIITFTAVVLFAVVLVAILIFAVDSVLSKLLDFIIPK